MMRYETSDVATTTSFKTFAVAARRLQKQLRHDIKFESAFNLVDQALQILAGKDATTVSRRLPDPSLLPPPPLATILPGVRLMPVSSRVPEAKCKSAEEEIKSIDSTWTRGVICTTCAHPDPSLTTHHSPHSPLTSPFTTRHSPLATQHSPLTTHHSPLTTHHSPLTNHQSQPPTFDMEKCEALARSLGGSFFRTSALTGEGVQEIFETLSKQVSEVYKQSNKPEGGKDYENLKLGLKGSEQKKGCC